MVLRVLAALIGCASAVFWGAMAWQAVVPSGDCAPSAVTAVVALVGLAFAAGCVATAAVPGRLAELRASRRPPGAGMPWLLAIASLVLVPVGVVAAYVSCPGE